MKPKSIDVLVGEDKSILSVDDKQFNVGSPQKVELDCVRRLSIIYPNCLIPTSAKEQLLNFSAEAGITANFVSSGMYPRSPNKDEYYTKVPEGYKINIRAE